jgi:hypothetical protein
MAAKRSSTDEKIARIARRQHGNVTRVQLLSAGLTRHQITGRVASGALIPTYPGVYRAGHAAPSVEADYMAAVLACGDGAALRGRAAAHLLGVLRGKAPPPEVLAPTKRRVACARRGTVYGSELTRWRGIPVTTPARTLVDLASLLGPDDLALACHEAGVRHQTTPRQVKQVLKRHPNAPGAAKFRAIFEGDAPAVLSWMERRALRSIAAAGLPRPQVNRKQGAHYIDLRWSGLTVELQSYRFHNSRHAWERDHDRRRAARARGDEFRSYTYDDVLEERTMVEEIAELLAVGVRDR